MSEARISDVSNISQLSHEILVKIIIYLNARERIALANSAKIFHTVVFKYKDLLRDLDFSKEGRLTSDSDIKQYFDNENTQNILKVDVRNVNCLDAEQMLNYIGRASNLVDVNIRGTDLKDLQQLGNFLEPLLHVKKLSIVWPKKVSKNDVAVLQKSFGILTSLSVKIYSHICMVNFMFLLKYCHELKKLHIIQDESNVAESGYFQNTADDPVGLRNLQIVEFSGNCTSTFKRLFMKLLPNRMEWTDFSKSNSLRLKGFYFEKNVEICQELVEIRKFKENLPNEDFNSIVPYICWQDLLEKVISTLSVITRSRLCCLSRPAQCFLKIEEAKELLKNPRYPITCMYLKHNVNAECDAHLLALAFPSLTKLHLFNITEHRNTHHRMNHSYEILRDSLLEIREEKRSQLRRWQRMVRARPAPQLPYIQVREHRDRPFRNAYENLRNSLSGAGERLGLPALPPLPPMPSFAHHIRELHTSCRQRPKKNDNKMNVKLNSSFKILVENTPYITDLTLDCDVSMLGNSKAWDLPSLDLIPKWKRLKSLRLSSIPIIHGEFLIEIGKQCKQLEKLELYDLGPSFVCCYTKQLSLMLLNCENLTDFSMKAKNAGQISDVLISLANNLKLRRVRLFLTTTSEINATANLTSSTEQLLRTCPNLTTFVCIIDGISEHRSNQLTRFMRRLRDELNRPTLQFQMACKSGLEVDSTIDTIFEDFFPPSFPYLELSSN